MENMDWYLAACIIVAAASEITGMMKIKPNSVTQIIMTLLKKTFVKK